MNSDLDDRRRQYLSFLRLNRSRAADGMTLIEVMVASGVASILLLGLLTTIAHLTKGQQGIAMNAAVEGKLQSVRLALSNPALCGAALSGKAGLVFDPNGIIDSGDRSKTTATSPEIWLAYIDSTTHMPTANIKILGENETVDGIKKDLPNKVNPTTSYIFDEVRLVVASDPKDPSKHIPPQSGLNNTLIYIVELHINAAKPLGGDDPKNPSTLRYLGASRIGTAGHPILLALSVDQTTHQVKDCSMKDTTGIPNNYFSDVYMTAQGPGGGVYISAKPFLVSSYVYPTPIKFNNLSQGTGQDFPKATILSQDDLDFHTTDAFDNPVPDSNLNYTSVFARVTFSVLHTPSPHAPCVWIRREVYDESDPDPANFKWVRNPGDKDLFLGCLIFGARATTPATYSATVPWWNTELSWPGGNNEKSAAQHRGDTKTTFKPRSRVLLSSESNFKPNQANDLYTEIHGLTIELFGSPMDNSKMLGVSNAYDIRQWMVPTVGWTDGAQPSGGGNASNILSISRSPIQTGQKNWVNVSVSRASNIEYFNANTYDISISVTVNSPAFSTSTLQYRPDTNSQWMTIATFRADPPGGHNQAAGQFFLTIPPGGRYQVNTTGKILSWFEYY